LKKGEEDDYIQRLIEMEIPKTELEKYEKIDVEKPKESTKETDEPEEFTEPEKSEVIVRQVKTPKKKICKERDTNRS